MTVANEALPNINLLPSAYHCAVTWSIPYDFGGMTSALLRRSRAFVTLAGQCVDIMTFEYQTDYDEVRCELEASGELIPGMQLRNLWDELSVLQDEDLSAASPGKRVKGNFSPIPPSGVSTDESVDGKLRRRIRRDNTNTTILQVDYFRLNGSIYVSDRRDAVTFGTEGGRHVTLCDSNGKPVASWNRMWPLYLFWLDSVVGGKETFMIVDSKSTANFITRFRRDHVVTMHMVHNSHMAIGQSPPYGELSSVRRYTFERLHTYDAIVLLTRRQKNDVDVAFGEPGNTCIIPNSTELEPHGVVENLRPPGEGVMLASLTKRKRIEHSILAMYEVRKCLPNFTLTIYGHGPEEDSLTRLVEANGLEDSVVLAGYNPEAKESLKTASFTLLTSKMEGLPLVLLEAMSAGCVPIAYDMPYGPADIIEDRVNGYLVRSGDMAALAARIVEFGQLGPLEIEGMRRSARATAERFGDHNVTSKWGEEMRLAVDRKLESVLERQ